MHKERKEEIVQEIRGIFSDITSVVLADYRGLDVSSVTSMREDFRKAGCGYRVLKNTLVKIAIDGSDVEGLKSLLSGPTAVIWSKDSPSAAAKLAVGFAKEKEHFKITGGFFDGQVLDEQGVKELATLPDADELKATLLMLFIAGPTDFVQQISAVPQQFVYLLEGRRRALEEQ